MPAVKYLRLVIVVVVVGKLVTKLLLKPTT